MSEIDNLTELTEEFLLGDPISIRQGIICQPAISKENNEQYMLKTLTIPASQTKVDALLFTGAYSSKEEVNAYFETLSEEIIDESKLINRLSEETGFIGFCQCSVSALSEGIGYRVELLSPYYTTLAQELTKKHWSHQQAINMALDICAALAHCRQAGYLYINLKPENIAIGQDGGCQICDMGLLPFKSLPYASLPEKYRSVYTAPEVHDSLSQLSSNMDVYALGCILYQLFNNGSLPDEELTPPHYADYELWQIIQKACFADPAQRYESPDAFGHALTTYAQQYGLSDNPIIPSAEDPQDTPAEESGFLSEEENQRQLADLLASIPDEEAPMDFLDDLMTEVQVDDADDDLTQILAQADDLILHEAPQPVVAPSIIDVQIPEIDEPHEEPTEQILSETVLDIPEAEVIINEEETIPTVPETIFIDESDTEESAHEDPIADEDEEEYVDEEVLVNKKRKRNKLIALCVAAVLMIAGLVYYNFFYTQRIESIEVQVQDDRVDINLNSSVKDELLSIVCIDTYGNTFRSAVKNGTATLTNLNLNAQYRIEVRINGPHRLIGDTTASFTTTTHTQILNLSAMCGLLDGSAVINFSILGNHIDAWDLEYEAEGVQRQFVSFTGTTVTVNGLQVGKEYTFTLVPQKQMPISGTTEIRYTAQNVITAQDLHISGATKDTLSVTWSLPEGVTEQLWSVRCYNGSDYDKTLETNQLAATFEGLSFDSDYTILITAKGMKKSITLIIPANPTRIDNYSYDSAEKDCVKITWTFTGSKPEGGWILRYRVDGSKEMYLDCADAQAKLPKYPGSRYQIQILAADGSVIVSPGLTFDVDAPTDFHAYGVTKDNMELYTCRTPNKTNWNRNDVKDADYTTTFSTNEKASFLIRLRVNHQNSANQVLTTIVIRSADGIPIYQFTTQKAWNQMWNQGYCTLDIPQIPKDAGNYNIDIYFDDMFVSNQSITIH